MLMNTGNVPVFSDNGLLTTIAYMIDGKPTYALEGSVFVAGAAVTWLRDSLRIIESSKETYERSLKELGHDLVFVPAFQGLGTPYWDNECKGAMFGISFNTTQESVIKATLEAIAYQAKDLMEEMKKETSLDKISLSVDGGASANDYLLQFESDIMQCVIKRPRQIETTALGAFFIAGLKLNMFDSFAALRKINETDKYYYPIMPVEDSLKLYSNWQKAVKACMMYK